MIAVIDYDAGNIMSVIKALESLGETPILTRDREEILNAEKVILPGVGAFGDAMEKLYHYNLVDTIYEAIKSGKPFLGVCLGLQLLFESSDEAPGVKGLGILPGTIRRIPIGEYTKIPHMGWNSLDFPQNGKLFKGVDEGAYVYFVHSYYLDAADKKDVVANTVYNTTINAAVERDNVFACQFHPEKSGTVGLQILKNFIEL